MLDTRNLVTKRTPHIVGRKPLLDRLDRYLHARGDRNYVYIYGSGGVGKTRVLETVQAMVERAGSGYYSTNIIDLFHTDSHSTSDVERTIADALDPGGRYFRAYREARDRYERMRESGTDPQVLETRRQQLSNLFVEGCRHMALDAHKVVLLFDTVELLQYESSIVEQLAELDTVDARIKAWLLNNLARLGNVLVVFAGRPKLPAPGESGDPQARLVDDMQRVFGDAFYAQELLPLTADEVREMMQELGGGHELVPEDLIPVVQTLTQGRPVFLHLVADLLLTLAKTPAEVEDIFRRHIDVVGRPEGDADLEAARREVQAAILQGIFNETTRYGWFLDRLAMMPKGVDTEILHETVGMSLEEASDLIEELRPLSFIKTYRAPTTEHMERQVLPGRIFLHDELYRLLRSKILPTWRYAEIQVAHALVRNYYDPQIAALEEEIEALVEAEARVPLRARMQKLQVERLYYLLVHDPVAGYEAYKRLTEEANWWRWVGYSNRLLDEFLRYYNDVTRRPEFERRGLDEATVIRESAVLWAERFYWWGQYERCRDFADYVLAPDAGLVPVDDFVTRAMIEARRLDALAVKQGFQEEDTLAAIQLLEQLEAVSSTDLKQLLAIARLSAAIGYQYQQGGLLDLAVKYYEATKTAFRELEVHTATYRGEQGLWLHALAFVYAEQGLLLLAMPLVREALRINESLRFEYNIGLTLSALSGIESMARQYEDAKRHADEALDVFRRLEDPHGNTLAHLKLIQALRHKAKQYLENRRKLEEAQQILQLECLPLAEEGTQVARANELDSLTDLLAETGRIHRDLGHVIARRFGFNEALPSYHNAVAILRDLVEKHKLPLLVKADIQQDLAEVLFYSKNTGEANQELAQIVKDIGEQYVIEPGTATDFDDLPVDRFEPLGKVELLRGQMIFQADPPPQSASELIEGMKHLLLAYAYFMLYSEQAIERDNMITYIFNYMNPVPLPTRRTVMETTRAWVEANSLGVDVTPFLGVLTRLLT